MNKIIGGLITVALCSALVSTPAFARDNINIVGSSTVFPFTTIVSEEFQVINGTLVTVEATGTGGGFQIFCENRDIDINSASRAIKDSEEELCEQNGVGPIEELMIGLDGIVLSSSINSEFMDFTLENIYNALAAKVIIDGEVVDNPYLYWSDIDPSLPSIEIKVFGPPPTSGTRDSFVELVMEHGCTLPEELENYCGAMREDGHFVEAGENDNLIVQKLEAIPGSVGIFGFSYLDNNRDQLIGHAIDGIEPYYEAIVAGEYEIARPLFIYIKMNHYGLIPGLEEFVSMYKDMLNYDSPLAEAGLITLE